ncbi:MAG: phage tail family protein [Dehalococcoidia bacterium]|nr:phage tail family protein [Dehalococcoidia bacterium]
MKAALTYSRGRIAVPTVESGTLIAREVGQFAAPLLSCPVRGSGRLQLPISRMTPASGSLVIYFDPDNAWNAGGQPANGYVFEWYDVASGYLAAYFNKAAGNWRIDRVAGTGSAEPTAAQTFAAGDPSVLYLGWDATGVAVAVNGSTIATQANTHIPASLPTTYDIGHAPNIPGSRFLAAYGAVVECARPLTQTEWEAFAALRISRPPLLGERINAAMSALWYGANPFTWKLPMGSTALDLVNTEGVTFDRLLGAGTAPVEHRGVETPLRDGKLYITSRLKERRLIARLVLEGDTAEGWYALRRELMAALTPRSGEGMLMYAPSRAVYEIDALLYSGLGIDDAEWRRGERPAVAFDCLDPAWRNAAQAAVLQAIPLSGWSLAWSIPWSFTASARSFVLTNDGDVPTYPVFTVTAGSGGASGIGFANTTTGKRYQTASSFLLAAGEVLTVDMDARTATKQDGTNQISQRTTTSEMWPLEVGDNAVTVSTESGSATVQAGFPRRYVGV